MLGWEHLHTVRRARPWAAQYIIISAQYTAPEAPVVSKLVVRSTVLVVAQTTPSLLLPSGFLTCIASLWGPIKPSHPSIHSNPSSRLSVWPLYLPLSDHL